ncbi:hypothetical protein M23134_02425 [Microscilla marina ATCC 23134]|uniref:Uncharacterized protein n=1 Tax=Microscilla marina ATCC 23134 TaxID=313606 RepID=A1ZKK8_MICM2|nr:hypothetical protein M23134_02425 [Microscilla marina ATCC 23134]
MPCLFTRLIKHQNSFFSKLIIVHLVANSLNLLRSNTD